MGRERPADAHGFEQPIFLGVHSRVVCRVVIVKARNVQQPVHRIEQQLLLHGVAKFGSPPVCFVNAHSDIRFDRLTGIGGVEGEDVGRARDAGVPLVEGRHVVIGDNANRQPPDGLAKRRRSSREMGGDPVEIDPARPPDAPNKLYRTGRLLTLVADVSAGRW